MPEMKNVGVREFRDHATKYLAGPETVAVNRHGRVIGFYIPLKRDEDEVRRAVAQLGQAVERVLDETGMTEDELASIFDMRKPFPE
jgi:antitoxin (DNA-binding transcriptional repressor) of toxin-antitoxin stability system